MKTARAQRYAAVRQLFEQPRLGAVVREPLKRGDAGIQQLTDKIQAAVEAASKTQEIFTLSRRIVRNVQPGDSAGEVKAVFDYFADDDLVPYRRDPWLMQIIPSAEAALTSLGSDCKGKTILVAACIAALGYPVRVVTVDQHVRSKGKPNRHHVYPEWQPPNRAASARPKSWRPGTWEAVDPVLATQLKSATVGDELPYRVKAIHDRSPA